MIKGKGKKYEGVTADVKLGVEVLWNNVVLFCSGKVNMLFVNNVPITNALVHDLKNDWETLTAQVPLMTLQRTHINNPI